MESDCKTTFQTAFEAWLLDKPRGKGAGEFIIALIRNAGNGAAASELEERLKKLGIGELVEMQRRRSESETRMLEQTGDLITDARAKAESEVLTELDALSKIRDSLEARLHDELEIDDDEKLKGTLVDSLTGLIQTCPKEICWISPGARNVKYLQETLFDTKVMLDLIRFEFYWQKTGNTGIGKISAFSDFQ